MKESKSFSLSPEAIKKLMEIAKREDRNPSNMLERLIELAYKKK